MWVFDRWHARHVVSLEQLNELQSSSRANHRSESTGCIKYDIPACNRPARLLIRAGSIMNRCTCGTNIPNLVEDVVEAVTVV